MPTRHAVRLSLVALLMPTVVWAADPFADQVRPFLATYCVQCHNATKKKADLDLARFDTSAKLLDDFRQWEHVVTFLKKEEMPPKDAKQPPATERAEMLATIEKVLLTEAKKLAGDPGVVPPRRLTNAEYDNTVSDLTGASISPAKAFPIDPASGEGFRNTGEALAMSPSLFKKYFAAAEFVADHALLSTEGVRFAPHPAVAFADRQKVYEQQVISFYAAHAVDVSKYLGELWTYKHRPAVPKADTVEAWATARKLSPKYARLLWDALEGKDADEFFVGWLRQRWAKVPAPKDATDVHPNEVQGAVKALAADAVKLGKELTPKETPAIVADAGNGPVEHLARRRQTAATRDTFDATAVASHKATVEYKNVPDQTTLRIVIDLSGIADTKADGAVVVKGGFTTNAAIDDKKKKSWTLREVLAEHAPDTFARLKFAADDSFTLKAPTTLELDIPAKAFAVKPKGNVTFTADVRSDSASAAAVSVRIGDKKADNSPGRPLVDPKHPLADKFNTSGAAFCRLFPSRFFYVDDTRGLSAGFHLIEGFFRDDQPLCKWVLSDAENAELNRLWRELYFATGIWEKMLRGFVFFERSERNFLKHKDFDEFKEEDPALATDAVLAKFQDVYLKRANVKATGDELAKHPISVFFTEVRTGLKEHGAALKKAEPQYLKDLLAFAERAYRRPLTDAERKKLESTYADVCRDPDHGTDAAVRATVTRILVSPHFALRFDATPAGDSVVSLPDLSLASRLSYFLWAGPPDAELLDLAKAGKLHDDKTLRAQVSRMLKDPKVSRFALEFFGQWLGYRDFLTQEAVNRQAFPAFDDQLKQAMFEEPTRLLTHLIQSDKPITDFLSGDGTVVNKKLAGHYGLTFDGPADEWRYVSGLKEKGRGGAMGMAVFLTKNSQPQRTSPVKRGFWVVHTLLGEHIPPPPSDVAVLPAKESDTNGKTIRQLLKLHVEDAKCASCHQRFDPVGLAMEGFDPIGKARTKDSGGRAVDNAVSLPDGTTARGVPEFSASLAKSRQAEFTRTLCQKLLGYALSRSLVLSDQPLLETMQAELTKSDHKLSVLFEIVATSPQFRTQRCADFTPAKYTPPGDRK